MTRKCSHCSHNGHNSRTCPNKGGLKLFGVRLTDGSIRKSASMGNLTLCSGPSANTPASPGDSQDHCAAADGYASEDFVPGSSSSNSRERRKGISWTENEHKLFLLGLQKLGKGDWRGISRNFVVSRTPTQVASHAQKYFIRQTNLGRRKRRSSLFDMIADEAVDAPAVRNFFPITTQQPEAESSKMTVSPPARDEACDLEESTNKLKDREDIVPGPENSQCGYPVLFPALFSPLIPFPFPLWSGYMAAAVEKGTHEIVKPTALHSTRPINVDELMGMSILSLREAPDGMLPPFPLLSQQLVSSRRSAFHSNPATHGSVP